MKIGLVICYHIKNYGSVLQAFATQDVVSKLGINNECINYQKSKRLKYLILNSLRIFNGPLLKTKISNIKKSIYAKKNYEKFGKNFEIRDKKFDEFIKNNFQISDPFVGYDQLKKGAKRYSAFLLGSDQVWNPLNFGSHYYTLEFVPDNIPKLTYAASFGVSEIPWYQVNKTKKYLNRIDTISVREEKGRAIIKNLIGRDVPVVLDPTLLLTKHEWKIVPENKIYDFSYIFCYFLGTNPKHREFANKLKEITGYKIVTLRHMDEIVLNDEGFGDVAPYDIGPNEFVNLIRNASYICTDSFHGTVFSIIHKKNFFSFKRYSDGKKASTNSRLYSILNMLGLESRLIDKKVDLNKMLEDEIDYDLVHKKLDDKREQSLDFLKKTLSQVYEFQKS